MLAGNPYYCSSLYVLLVVVYVLLHVIVILVIVLLLAWVVNPFPLYMWVKDDSFGPGVYSSLSLYGP